MSCYRYLLEYGHDRPESKMRRSPKQMRRICRHCRRAYAGPQHSDLCGACYQYQKQNGKPRPRHLWTEYCKVCGRPRRADRRDRFAKGRCPTCYAYRHKHGEDRPRELIEQQVPLGWCQCGNPATVEVELAYGDVNTNGHQHGYTDTYALCEQCAALEKREQNGH